MRSLLDINVVIALLDSNHAFHQRAHKWWESNIESGWASCPLTENGVVRVMSNPAYSETLRLAPGELIVRLQNFADQTDHEFWPDDLSLRDSTVFVAERMHSSRQLTDVYLLGLAVAHGGCLATFDQGVPLSVVSAAKNANLQVL
jgi:toxin-antitoxin system PIN domain toxin